MWSSKDFYCIENLDKIYVIYLTLTPFVDSLGNCQLLKTEMKPIYTVHKLWYRIGESLNSDALHTESPDHQVI